MKKLLYPFAAIVFAMLPALSCNKESAVKVVDLASLTADYEAKDGETLSGILGGRRHFLPPTMTACTTRPSPATFWISSPRANRHPVTFRASRYIVR